MNVKISSVSWVRDINGNTVTSTPATEIPMCYGETGTIEVSCVTDVPADGVRIDFYYGAFVEQSLPLPNTPVATFFTPNALPASAVAMTSNVADRDKNGDITIQFSSPNEFVIRITGFVPNADLKGWATATGTTSNRYRMLSRAITDSAVLQDNGDGIWGASTQRRLGVAVRISDEGDVAPGTDTSDAVAYLELEQREVIRVKGRGRGEIYTPLNIQLYNNANGDYVLIFVKSSSAGFKLSVRETATNSLSDNYTPGQFTEILHTTSTNDFTVADPNIPYAEYPAAGSITLDPDFFIGNGSGTATRNFTDCQTTTGIDLDLDGSGDPKITSIALGAQQVLYFPIDRSKFYWIVSTVGDRNGNDWEWWSYRQTGAPQPPQPQSDEEVLYLPIDTTFLNEGTMTSPTFTGGLNTLSTSNLTLSITNAAPVTEARAWLLKFSSFDDSGAFNNGYQIGALPDTLSGIANTVGNVYEVGYTIPASELEPGEEYYIIAVYGDDTGYVASYLSERLTASDLLNLSLTGSFSTRIYRNLTYPADIRLSPRNRVRLVGEIDTDQAGAVTELAIDIAGWRTITGYRSGGSWITTANFTDAENLPYATITEAGTTLTLDVVIRVQDIWIGGAADINVRMLAPVASDPVYTVEPAWRLHVDQFENDKPSPEVLVAMTAPPLTLTGELNACAVVDEAEIIVEKSDPEEYLHFVVHQNERFQHKEDNAFAVTELPQIQQVGDIVSNDPDFGGDNFAQHTVTAGWLQGLSEVVSIAYPDCYAEITRLLPLVTGEDSITISVEGTADNFHYQIATNPSFSPVLTSSIVPATTFTFSALTECDQYFVRVRGEACDGSVVTDWFSYNSRQNSSLYFWGENTSINQLYTRKITGLQLENFAGWATGITVAYNGGAPDTLANIESQIAAGASSYTLTFGISGYNAPPGFAVSEAVLNFSYDSEVDYIKVGCLTQPVYLTQNGSGEGVKKNFAFYLTERCAIDIEFLTSGMSADWYANILPELAHSPDQLVEYPFSTVSAINAVLSTTTYPCIVTIHAVLPSGIANDTVRLNVNYI